MPPLPSSLLSLVPVGPKVPLGVPDEFRRLDDLAYNLWWSWRPDAIDLFRSIDPATWDRTGNPMAMMHTVEPATWDRLAQEEDCVTSYGSVTADFDRYLEGSDTWFAANHGDGASEALDGPVAYLCTEFGLNQKLRLYSGGLGILAGDHVKAASDLGIPLVAVGLLYRRGYFQQAVDPFGAQEHMYAAMDLAHRPIREVLDPGTGRPLRVRVAIGGRIVSVGAWRVEVGRVPVILLDTDNDDNEPPDRPITHFLYVRGREMRLAQEIVLGIGGTRVLAECDPAGGDVAAWAQLPVEPGWSTAISGADRNWSAIVDHTQELPSGLRVMTAPARPSQARAAVIEASSGFSALFRTMPEAVMIADCGRVELDAPPWARAAQLTLLLLRQATVSAQATVARVDRTIEALEVLRGRAAKSAWCSSAARRTRRMRSRPCSVSNCSASCPRTPRARRWSAGLDRGEAGGPQPTAKAAAPLGAHVVEAVYGRGHRFDPSTTSSR